MPRNLQFEGDFKLRKPLKEGIKKLLPNKHAIKQMAPRTRYARSVQIALALASLMCLVHADQFSQSTATRFAEYAFASYCGIDTISDWNCFYCVNSTVGFTPLYSDYDPNSKSAVFLGVHDQYQEIVVSFRGTVADELENWLKDLEIWRSSTSYFTNGITVHSGFKDLYQVHRDTILKYLQEIVSTYPTYNVRITGHSLGGALATIMALDVQLNYNIQNVKLLTFGSPRVGNAAFASAFNASTIQHFRLVHAKDPVPHFPEMLFGFHHAAEEVWQVSDDSFSMCNLSGEDPNCSLSVGLPFSIDDHRLYLGLPTTDVCTGDQDTAIM